MSCLYLKAENSSIEKSVPIKFEINIKNNLIQPTKKTTSLIQETIEKYNDQELEKSIRRVSPNKAFRIKKFVIVDVKSKNYCFLKIKHENDIISTLISIVGANSDDTCEDLLSMVEHICERIKKNCKASKFLLIIKSRAPSLIIGTLIDKQYNLLENTLPNNLFQFSKEI